jgi:hypothetical protein
MRATSRWSSSATTVATTTASSDAGRARCRRVAVSMTTATTTTTATAASRPDEPTADSARTATTAVFSPSGFGTPSAAGTCCRKMIAAMPTVNPSTTGQGTYARHLPRRANEAATSIAPAMIPTT